jgi:hypothetical protein
VMRAHACYPIGMREDGCWFNPMPILTEEEKQAKEISDKSGEGGYIPVSTEPREKGFLECVFLALVFIISGSVCLVLFISGCLLFPAAMAIAILLAGGLSLGSKA